jgi:serine/threonine protein kinase
MASCLACRSENAASATTCAHCGSPMPLAAGTVIAARYEISGVIGSGGMGVVYQARDRALDERVALKVLRSDLAGRHDLARRFLSEIKLARRVGHRNVCRVFEYGEDGRIRYIAMEFVDGVTLRQMIRRQGRLSLTEGFEAAIQVASGLEAIHEHGVVHRDLKSANIMRDARGVFKIMDFGVAKEWSLESVDATATGVVIGSIEYMSPEQATGVKVDARSDVYSLGIVIYETFTGSVPFKIETPIAAIMKHIHEQPPLDGVEGLPPVLVPVLRRALAKTPGDRYATAGEMLAALGEARSKSALSPRQVLAARGGTTLTRTATRTIAATQADAMHAPQTTRSPDETQAGEPSQATTVKPPDTVQVTIALGKKHILVAMIALIGIAVGVGFAVRLLLPPKRSAATAPAPSTPFPSNAATLPGVPRPSPVVTSTPAVIVHRPATQTPRIAPPPIPSPTGVSAAQLSPLDRPAEKPKETVSFVQSETFFTPPASSGAPPGMGALPPGVTVKPAAAPAPQARLVIEIDPPQLRPGDAYVIRYIVFNQSQSALSLTAASVRNDLGQRASTGGKIDLAAKLALPRKRTLLLETRDTWAYDRGTPWSTTLTLMLDDGSVYSSRLEARR